MSRVGNLGCLVIWGWKRRVLGGLQEKERGGGRGGLESRNGLGFMVEEEGEKRREECEVKKSAIFFISFFFNVIMNLRWDM